MSSAPTISPTTAVEGSTLHIFPLIFLVPLIGYSCVAYGFRYTDYINERKLKLEEERS